MEPRPFSLKIYPEYPREEDIDRRLPPHKLVIEPLLQHAIEIVVHQKATYAFDIPIPPHLLRRKTIVLEPSSDIVAGWPSFWNSGWWKRGAISIKVPVNQVNWISLFAVSEYIGVWASRHQILKGTPSGTVKYADKNANGNDAVFSLSASNGIQWLDVWLPTNISATIEAQAKEQCGRFVCSSEQDKFHNEIVYDQAPYANSI